MKTFYFEAVLAYFEKKKKFKKFYVRIFFSKNSNFNFFKTSTTPRGINGIYGLWGHNEGENHHLRNFHSNQGQIFQQNPVISHGSSLENLLKIFIKLIATK